MKEAFIEAANIHIDDSNVKEAHSVIEIDNETDSLNLRQRVDDLQIELKGRISKIVNELSATSAKQKSTEPWRKYTSLLAKQNDELTQENLTLKQDNDFLKERLNVLALVMSDLKKQLEITESEKQSLVTVIKMLQDQPGQAEPDVIINSHNPANGSGTSVLSASLESQSADTILPEIIEDNITEVHVNHQPTSNSVKSNAKTKHILMIGDSKAYRSQKAI